MQADHWKLLKKLFLQALDREPGERGKFLDEACDGDQGLRDQVEALIDSDSKSSSFMESPLELDGFVEEDRAPLIGAKVGQYRIDRVLSSGGMGTVYLATQETPHRSVAVKVMDEKIASPSALRRFEYESEILARLTHPHIAQVIESGTYVPDNLKRDSGIPYFVMEYVPDALSITDYAWQKKLSIRERLTLFNQVCGAVHHGHQKGIIHRDLKPPNILVNTSGQVKVIDFGIARVTDSDLRLTTAQTDVGQLIGTVQYMSPEQCEADATDLDIRSDVYSLGIVLYELLCEKLPYDVRKAILFEATRIIRETEPDRPSTTNRALRGDVETILLKTLEKDRNNRYQTVSELAGDIERFLNGEVILARPAGISTRVLKCARRNPVRSTALLVGLAAVTVFLGYTFLVYAPELRYERDVADGEKRRAVAAEQVAVRAREDAESQRREALRAKEVAEQEKENTDIINSFLEDMFALADPFKAGREIRMLEVLDRAVERIDVKFPDGSRIEASLRDMIGSTYIDFGAYAPAEQQLRKALEIRARVLGVGHEDTLSTRNGLGIALVHLGKFSEAEPVLRETHAACIETLGAEHPVTLHVKQSLASLLLRQSRFSESEELLRDALRAGRAVLGVDHETNLSTMYTLANLLSVKGDLAEAESLLREVVSMWADAFGEEHPDTLNAMNGLGNVLQARSKYAEAETLFLKISESYRKMLGEEHPFTLGVMNNLTIVFMIQGMLEKAETYSREIYGIRQRVLGEEHPDTLRSLNNLAVLLERQDNDLEAERIHRQLVSTRTHVLGEEHRDTLNSSLNLTEVLEKLDRVSEAEAIIRRVLEIHLSVTEEENSDTIRIRRYLAGNLKRQGRHEEAEVIYLQAIEAAARLFTHPNISLAALHSGYGDCLRLMKRFDEAEPWLLQAHEAYAESGGPKHRWTLSVVQDLILLYEDWQKPEERHRWQAVLDEKGRE